MSAANRRTVVRGAAWSVPVVAIAAAAPSASASPASTPEATATIDYNSPYITITIINTGTVPIPAGSLSAQTHRVIGTITCTVGGWLTSWGASTASLPATAAGVPFYSQLPVPAGQTVQLTFQLYPKTGNKVDVHVWLGSTLLAQR